MLQRCVYEANASTAVLVLFFKTDMQQIINHRIFSSFKELVDHFFSEVTAENARYSRTTSRAFWFMETLTTTDNTTKLFTRTYWKSVTALAAGGFG